MGYYTSVLVNLTVREDRLQAFHCAVEEMKGKTGQEAEWFRYYDDLRIGDEGAVEFGDYYRKWYDSEQFYEFIKDFVKSGEITGYGDEFENYWRIVFDGNGGWKRQVPVFVDEAGEDATAGSAG
mgnify:CR=1 FL=1